MTVWVSEMRHWRWTGVSRGFPTADAAHTYVAAMRQARDTSPVWSEYRRQAYDWHVRSFTSMTESA